MPPDTPDEVEETLIDEVPVLGGAGPIHVVWREAGIRQERTFNQPFTLGRDSSCEIQIADSGVSRSHAQIYPDGGQWHVKDLDSGNGSFLDDIRIHVAVLPKSSVLQLGRGPKIGLNVPAAPENITEEEIQKRYFSKMDATSEVGVRTAMTRDVYRRVDRKQKRRYRGIIAVVVVALIASLGVGWYQYQVLQKTRDLATEIFYNMKAVEVQVAKIEDLVSESHDQGLLDEVKIRRREVRALEEQYDRFLDELDILGPDLSEKDRVILRVARIFGECELTMPPEFTAEVNKYIHQWRLSPRLRRSLERMKEQNLTEVVVGEMLENNLPPQFLYVALQESSFRKDAIGPKTRFGIAKGIWQFIPSTARRYGLRTGPLVELPVADPSDDRHNPELSTKAAARYLRDIYSKDAQASGLLVMASYNWGPNNIRKRIREMPDNPRERNFWELLKRNEIPRETYDYVFYIVSAIVIGEDPALFGFDFENPLLGIEESLGGSAGTAVQ
ncbi:MAG: transglycosylase SLT domain-containing protein [Deltaproteobacteria bacterium]|nr:transglycosylase SLT domain-containing protein [Deltaproteobacteria bacterium]